MSCFWLRLVIEIAMALERADGLDRNRGNRYGAGCHHDCRGGCGDDYLEVMVALSLIVGAIYVLFALLRMGWVALTGCFTVFYLRIGGGVLVSFVTVAARHMVAARNERLEERAHRKSRCRNR